MDELEKSLKYVPTYQVVEQIRKEEKKIAREKLALEKDKTKRAEQEKERVLLSAANFLLEKKLDITQIAKILEVTPLQIEKIIKKHE